MSSQLPPWDEPLASKPLDLDLDSADSDKDELPVFSSQPSTSFLPKDRPAEPSSPARPTRTLSAILSSPSKSRGDFFKGLFMYFFPNNNVNPARRFRMRKVESLGAVVVKKWSSNITHTVIDLGLKYEELLTHLGLDEISKDVVVVNEHYITDCIKFKTAVDAGQIRYAIPRAPTSDVAASKKLRLLARVKTFQEKAQIDQRESPPPPPLALLEPPALAKKRSAPELTISPKRSRNPLLSSPPLEPPDGAPSSQLVEYNDALIGAIDDVNELEEAYQLEFSDSDPESDSNKGYIGKSVMKDSSKPANTKGNKTKNATSDQFTGFICMQKNEAKDAQDTPNGRTIEMLQKMLNYYERVHDQWRTLAYRKAIASLKRQTTRITTKEEAARIPFIGERLAEKIEEIVQTDQLRRLRHALSNPRDEALQLFLGIFGISYATANKWVSRGLRTLEDLRADSQVMGSLTENQRVGLEHYHDFHQRIPRAEVAAHAGVVRAALARLEPAAEMEVMGSFRRGADTCGDIDILITRRGATVEELRELLHDRLVPHLTAAGFLRIALIGKRGNSKWYGVSSLDYGGVPSCPPHQAADAGASAGEDPQAVASPRLPLRRIDLLVVPPEELGAAKLYFTGNNIFNRSMRLLAHKKGMRLSQSGLFRDVLRKRPARGDSGQSGPSVKLTQGTLVEAADERKIFEALGLKWRPPSHRNP